MLVVALTHRTAVLGAETVAADLRDAQAVPFAFESIRPSIVIHAAFASDAASIVAATRNVIEGASRVGADVLHVSTDAVFSGDGSPREENSQPDPVWDYGHWKAEAENLVLSAPAGAIVRLPLVVSLDPEDRAVERIRQGALRNEPTRWFQDEVRQPAMASDIAVAVWRIASLGPYERAGIWQLPGPESLNRYEIAQRVAQALNLAPSSILSVPTPIDADRPRHIKMLDDRARTQFNWKPARILS